MEILARVLVNVNVSPAVNGELMMARQRSVYQQPSLFLHTGHLDDSDSALQLDALLVLLLADIHHQMMSPRDANCRSETKRNSIINVKTVLQI